MMIKKADKRKIDFPKASVARDSQFEKLYHRGTILLLEGQTADDEMA